MRSNSTKKGLMQKGLIKISPLLLLSTLLVSCDVQTNNKSTINPSSSEIKIPISSLPIEIAPLFKPDFLKQISSNCEKKKVKKYTDYGHWETYSECKSPVIEKYPNINSFKVHRSTFNEINGFSFLSLNYEIIDYLDDKYGIAFQNHNYYCTKYGESGLRRFYVVKKELCAALSYKNL